MKFGARNQLVAEITDVKKGTIMCQVKLKLKGTDATMASVMTCDSLDDLGVKKGDVVRVLVKAVNVLIARE